MVDAPKAIFLSYASQDAEAARRIRAAEAPLIDFTALDGVRHAIWRVTPDDGRAFVGAFETVEAGGKLPLPWAAPSSPSTEDISRREPASHIDRSSSPPYCGSR